MSKDLLSNQVSDLQGALNIIESQLSSGDNNRAALEDFKVAVDNVRSTILAILGASHSTNYRTAIGKFHIERAIELSQSVMSDVVLGNVSQSSESWEDFHKAAVETLERLDIMTGNAIGRLN